MKHKTTIRMKKILTLLSALLALTACQDDLGLPSQGGDTADGLTDIYLAQPDMPVVITRADGSTDEEDSRVESVILFVFDNQGNLLNQEPVQQSVTPVDPVGPNNYPRYRFRAYLPSERHSLYAVCNYDAPDELISFVKNKGEGTTYSSAQEALQAYVTPAIASAEDAYKGVYVMEGHTEDFTGNITIPVKRILSRHTFTITFDPVVEGDGFKLSSVSLFNVPRISKLVDDPDYTFGDEEAADADRYTNWTGDAVWFDTNTTVGGTAPEGYYLGTDPGDYAPTGEQATDTELLDVQQGTDEEGHDTYTATAHLYENRRGAEPATEVDAALLIDADGVGDGVGYPEDERENIRQLFKRALALGESPYNEGQKGIEKHPYATCLVIEGLYDRADENAADARVRYFVYLGHDNYGDFNVQRNHNYEYDITIKAADRFDTRVKTQNLAKLAVTVSKENEPFDAHFNVREALIYSSLDWEVYVENPDATPWLEVSTSATYIPRPLGNDLTGYESNLNLPNGNNDEGRVYAQYRLKGRESLKYFYIHTDEYVPKTNKPTDNGNLKPRTGKVIVKCGTGSEAINEEITVTQYPAQLVEVTAWDINQAQNVTHRFFVERIVEEKYKNWGFTHFWNLTLDNLISTGNYDGLNNTRKEYVSAIWGDKDSQSFEYRTETISDPAPLELNGRQNAADWEETEEGAENDDVFDPALKGDDAIFNLSSSYALGYALAKNRDRNGNGRIDYNEIMWYLPAREQLAAICKALNGGQLKGTDYEETNRYPRGSKPAFSGNYWSSTPSVADKYGITTGRAYYHTFSTDDGKSGIGLRDQSFNVIVCRDADGWTGPETGGGSGDVNIDPDWSEEPDVNMPGK